MRKQTITMPNTARLLTADELERMPECAHGYELVDGRLIRMSPVGYDHGRVVMGFGAMLHNHAKARGLGDVLTELGCKLTRNPDTVRAPDIAFIRHARTTAATRGFWNGAPDLVVEVLSPEDRLSDVRDKVREYLTHGVIAVLVVDPHTTTVAIHRRLTLPVTLQAGDELDLDDIVDGFRCGVGEIFE